MLTLATGIVRRTCKLPLLILLKYNSTYFPHKKFKMNDVLTLGWSLGSDEIIKRTDDLISTTNSVYEAIKSLPIDQATFSNVVEKINECSVNYSNQRNMLSFYQHVSTDSSLRQASVESNKKFSDFEVQLRMNKDVFKRIEAIKMSNPTLDDESSRLLNKMYKDGKRNGLHLTDDIQEKLKEMFSKMSQLSIDYEHNLGENVDKIYFSEKDLDGLPMDFISSLETNDKGLKTVTMKYPHVIPIMEKACNPDTRRLTEAAFNSRCLKENTPILEELITLRHKVANLLSYSTHAEYIQEILMAKNPTNVRNFLNDLASKLEQQGSKEIERLLILKKEECLSKNLPFDGKINAWDRGYYMKKVEEIDYFIDHEQLKEYFPCEYVVEEVFIIYQTIFHLEFVKENKYNTWHNDVTIYAVYDTAAADKSLIGYFYLDLHPRDGKYGHAACFGLQEGCINIEKQCKQLSVAAMVANFTKPTANRPSLLTHDEVETFFHEFGHVIHQICSHSKYVEFAGTSVERDFVEAPSQMLENWAWQPEVLKKISRHYIDNKPLSDELIQKLIRVRKANVALFNLRQICLSMFDLTIHSKSEANTFETLSEMQQKYMKIPITPGTNMSASFGHMAGGYDAQYYGYLWSEVFSCDMFASTFLENGIMNPETGLLYRKNILEPGSTKDASVLLRNFLGREPNSNAFLEIKGIPVTAKL